ncbi:MAG TPA: LLM class flavin-dependent oxidoreductase, partial [Euzebya sp.]|nr:LLM class flavin-dependent oxidoreductase [Euzebya sp.]
GLHGIPWDGPIGKLRTVLIAVRELLQGGRLPQTPNDARPLGVSVTPDQPIPLALASLSPRTIHMAGELADRWLPFLWPRSQLAEGRRLLAEGASAAGRATLPAIVPAVPLAVGADHHMAERTAARWLTTYCTRMGPIYPRLLRERFGYAAEVDALLAANADGGVPVLPPASRRLADDVLILATHEEIGAAVSGWTDAGADRVDVVLPIDADEDALQVIVHAAAPSAARHPAVTSGARS